MNTNVLPVFGVKKTKHSKLDAAPVEDDETAALRLRSLPENIREDLKALKAQLAGEGVKNAFKSMSDIQKKFTQKVTHLRRSNRIFTWGDGIPQPLIDFSELSSATEIGNSLKEFGIKDPTPIQMQAMPLMMQKRNVLCCAPTGSGKTLAFALPLILQIACLKKKFKNEKKLFALVLEPTLELADQTERQFVNISEGLGIASAVYKQDIIPEVDILVSTPDHLMHHLSSFDFSELRWLVVDESDRLFEAVEGEETCFRTQVVAINKACNGSLTKRAFFSATISYEVEEWCKENLTNVAMLCIAERNSANTSVNLVHTSSEQGKKIALRNLLQTQFQPPALVFVQSKERIKELVSVISGIEPPIDVEFISTEKSQEERDKVLKSLSDGRVRLLVCTELMGRGLDLENVNLVINYDHPTSIVSYIHRIGRTGRAVTYFNDNKYLCAVARAIHGAGFEVEAYRQTLKTSTRNHKQSTVPDLRTARNSLSLAPHPPRRSAVNRITPELGGDVKDVGRLPATSLLSPETKMLNDLSDRMSRLENLFKTVRIESEIDRNRWSRAKPIAVPLTTARLEHGNLPSRASRTILKPPPFPLQNGQRRRHSLPPTSPNVNLVEKARYSPPAGPGFFAEDFDKPEALVLSKTNKRNEEIENNADLMEQRNVEKKTAEQRNIEKDEYKRRKEENEKGLDPSSARSTASTAGGRGHSQPPQTASTTTPSHSARPTPRPRGASAVEIKATKGNRELIINTLKHNIFIGPAGRNRLAKVMNAIVESDEQHFLILFMDRKCQYRGLYTWDEHSSSVKNISGQGPANVSEKRIKKMFTVDTSRNKSFSKMRTKRLGAAVDGFTIKKSYWQKPEIPTSAPAHRNN